MVKRWILSWVLALCLVAGCEQTSQERLDAYKQTAQGMQQVSAQLGTGIDAMTEAMDQAAVVLDDPAIAEADKAKVLGEVEKLKTNLAEAVAKKADVDGKLAKMTALIEQAAAGGQLSDELKLYADGIGAAAPYLGKYGAYAIILQLILNVVSAIAAAKKNTEAKVNAEAAATAQAKYQAHKVGVEATIKTIAANETTKPAAVAAILYDNIGKARAAAGVA